MHSGTEGERGTPLYNTKLLQGDVMCVGVSLRETGFAAAHWLVTELEEFVVR